MEWWVFYEDFNRRKIEKWNVFDNYSFRKNVARAVRRRVRTEDGKRRALTKEEFLKEVAGWLMYCYWGKCEWEIIISSWPPSSNPEYCVEKKVDVYEQVMLNWDKFSEYVWEHRGKVRRLDKDESGAG